MFPDFPSTTQTYPSNIPITSTHIEVKKTFKEISIQKNIPCVTHLKVHRGCNFDFGSVHFLENLTHLYIEDLTSELTHPDKITHLHILKVDDFRYLPEFFFLENLEYLYYDGLDPVEINLDRHRNLKYLGTSKARSFSISYYYPAENLEVLYYNMLNKEIKPEHFPKLKKLIHEQGESNHELKCDLNSFVGLEHLELNYDNSKRVIDISKLVNLKKLIFPNSSPHHEFIFPGDDENPCKLQEIKLNRIFNMIDLGKFPDLVKLDINTCHGDVVINSEKLEELVIRSYGGIELGELPRLKEGTVESSEIRFTGDAYNEMKSLSLKTAKSKIKEPSKLELSKFVNLNSLVLSGPFEVIGVSHSLVKIDVRELVGDIDLRGFTYLEYINVTDMEMPANNGMKSLRGFRGKVTLRS